MTSRTQELKRSEIAREFSYESLLRKNIILIVVLVSVFAGLLDAVVTYRSTIALVRESAETEVSWAQQLVDERLSALRRDVYSLARLPWGAEEYGAERMLVEIGKLQRGSPDFVVVAFVHADWSSVATIGASVKIDASVSRIFDGAELDLSKLRLGEEFFSSYGMPSSDEGDLLLAARTTQSNLFLVARLRSRSVNRALAQASLMNGSRAFVMDSHNLVLAHSVSAWVGRQMPQDAHVGASTSFWPWKYSLANDLVIRIVRDIPKSSWRIGIEYPASLVVDRLWEVPLRMSSFIVGGLLLGMLFGRRFALIAAAPILRITEVAKKLTNGDMQVRALLDGPDEVRQLASAFNTMAASVGASRENLEAKILEKTGDLEAANVNLASASRHKSEFLAHMSHELRTPLNAVIGFSDLLKAQYFGPLNQKQAEYVRDINASGQHLLSLINDILDLAKVEAGRMELVLSDCHVATLMESCVALVSERVSRSRQTLTTDVSPEVATWPLDERKVKQCLLNLLTNASKFTPAGGAIALRVWAQSSEGDERSELVAAVSDNGVGIGAEDLPNLFSEFYQAKAADDASGVAAQREGTGLGLALTKGFVELHGGTISVESVVGKSSTFTMRFPAKPEVVADKPFDELRANGESA